MRNYPDIPVEKVRKGKPTWWRVSEPVLCEDSDVRQYIIPEGFVTNFASVPRLLYPLIPPHGLSAIPSVKHDYRYVELVGAERSGHRLARYWADRQYYFDLLDAGVPKQVVLAMYWYVRALGWYKWNQHAKRKVLELMKK